MLQPGPAFSGWIFFLTGAVTVVLTATVVSVMIAAQRRRMEQARQFSRRLVGAQEAERSRIAQELHDDIIQRVALIGGEVSALSRLLDEPSAAVNQRIEGLREELYDLAEEIRAMARRAHPSTLEHLGLVKSIEALAGEMRVSDGLEVTVRIDQEPAFDRLSQAAALSLFRVAQEGLRNVARHAGTDRATLRLRSNGGGVVLRVEDRGGGMAADARKSAGLGLPSLTERLHAVQGRLDIISEPGRGTTLEAWVPLEGRVR